MRNRLIWISLAACLAAGCNRNPGNTVSEDSLDLPSADVQTASYRTGPPQRYLAAVFARYRNAASYRDRGIVRLRFRGGDGREESRSAPMRVWYNHGRLYVEAYDVRLKSDATSRLAWISDPGSDDFDSQVLKQPGIENRPTLETLFADPILADRISAGLAGPPPQLDWLLAREPMKHLFHESHRFQFGPSRAVDGKLCRGVRVTAGDELFEFWIDEQAGLIRRIDLPPIAAPEVSSEVVAGGREQTMSLSVELSDASFDEPLNPPDVKPLPKQPKYVRQFVPLPPPGPSRDLGTPLRDQWREQMAAYQRLLREKRIADK